MLTNLISNLVFIALITSGCGEATKLSGRHVHNAPSSEEHKSEKTTDRSVAKGCHDDQLSVGGTGNQCVDKPKALPLSDLGIKAFADYDLDQRCQAINDALTAIATHGEPLKLSGYTCRQLPAFSAKEGPRYDVDATITRPDGKSLVFWIYLSELTPYSAQITTKRGNESKMYSNGFFVSQDDYDFSVGLLDLSPSLNGFLNAAATKPASIFGKPYTDFVKQACSDIEKNGLEFKDYETKKVATATVSFGTCANGTTSGPLKISAISADFFAGLTANKQNDNGLLGYLTAADAIAATDITWIFANDQLTLARAIPKGEGASGHENVAVSYKIKP